MHGGPVASFTPKVPATAAIVVRCKPNTTVLYAAMLVSATLVAGLVVAVTVFALWLGAAATPLLALVPLLLVQLWFTVVVVREYRGLLGPQLAADRSGVWVRTGQGARPEAVFLPWQRSRGSTPRGRARSSGS